MTDRPGFTHRRERHGLVGPFSGRQLVGAILAVIVAAIVLALVTAPLGTIGPIGPNDPRATQFVIGPSPSQGLRPGDLAPDFESALGDGTTYRLTDLDGDPVRLADLRGKAVWINFWASWCPPCQAETPVLRDLAERYEDRGLVVLGISVQESSEADIRAYAERYLLGYRIAADLSGHIFRLYRLYGIPTQFFVGPEGAIRSVVNAPLTEADAIAQIEAILPPGHVEPTGVPSSSG